MGSEWSTACVGDAFDLVNGYAFKSKEFVESGIPVIKIKNIKAGFFSEHEFSYVDPSYVAVKPDKAAKSGDVLISMSGNRHDGSPDTWVGKVAYFDRLTPYMINQRVGALRIKDESLFDSKYMSYLLASWDYQTLFISIATSSGGQANLSPKQILQAPIKFPGIQAQKRIADFLGTLDNKIALNRQINTTLESMAQALFKSWFVDFDPVIDNALAAGHEIPDELQARADRRRALLSANTETAVARLSQDIQQLFPDRFVFTEEMGWVPEGWEVSKLGELAKFKNGKSSPERDGGDVAVYGSNGVIGYCNESNRSNVVIIGRVGTYCGSLYLCTSECWVTDNAMTGEMKDVANNIFLYELLKTASLNDRSSGSGQPLLNQKILGSIYLAAPPVELIAEFSRITNGLYDQLFAKQRENVTLANLRDSLLPKLLSGQLSIPEAERALDKVN